MMMPGADGVHPGAAFGPSHRFCHDPQRIAALGELIGVERVGDLIGLDRGQLQ
jgi:hypothetical protein